MKTPEAPVLVVLLAFVFIVGVGTGTQIERAREGRRVSALQYPDAQRMDVGQQGYTGKAEGDRGMDTVPASVTALVTAARLNAIQHALKTTMTIEEAAFAENARYTSDISAYGRASSPGDSVSVELKFVAQDGYIAEGTHLALPGWSCVLYMGNASELPYLPATAHDSRRPAGPAEITCDTVPQPRK